MGNYTRWYRVGNVKLVQGSRTIEGTDTYWLTAGLNPGDLFTVDGAQFYEVSAITDNTHLTLNNTYAGTSTTDSAYSIIRNFTATMPAEIASRTAELLGDFRKYIDTDMRSIHGESAYEIAVQNGYVGTEKQWLESLKASGELQKLSDSLDASNDRITALESSQGTLSSLSTSSKDSLVSALNEVLTNIGALSSLSTSARSSLVASINELVNHQGSLSSLSTGVKSTIVAAINEVLANEGALSSLTTSAKTTLAAAINEVKSATTTNATNISILTTRTEHIADVNARAYHAGFAHNLIYRGKCLGDKLTAEQLAAIRNGTFDDMYLGDYWTGVGNAGWTGMRWMIVHFNYFGNDWLQSWMGLTNNVGATAHRALGFGSTTYGPHVTIMQMAHATATEARNQKGGILKDYGDDLDHNYGISDRNSYFFFGESGTTSDAETGEGGYRAKVLHNAIYPTFGKSVKEGGTIMNQAGFVRKCSTTGLYTGRKQSLGQVVLIPYLSHLTGQYLPQSDEKFHELAYVDNDTGGQTRIDVNRRQFAAFQCRPFSIRGLGSGTEHAIFWLRDMLGPDGSGNPMGLLGEQTGDGSFRPRPLSCASAKTSYHVYFSIA